nr:hypothetical protein Iba_chr10cCG4220 [Ipomoea batatas]
MHYGAIIGRRTELPRQAEKKTGVLFRQHAASGHRRPTALFHRSRG